MRRYRTYDHRVKQMIIKTGDPNFFPDLKIPRSTALGWIKNGIPEVVTVPSLDLQNETLVTKLFETERHLLESKEKQKLSIFVFKLFGFQIQYTTC
jgi:hypothetical protein